MMSAKKYLSKDSLAAEIIIALADNDLSITKTSIALYVHSGTVRYHLKKVRESTGLNPLKFYDLCKLLPVAKKILEKG